MKSKLIIIFFLLCSTCWAGDFVCHNGGTITQTYQSVDGSNLGAECLKISRVTLESITKYHKVDPSIVGTNDDKVVEMSQAEKDALDAAEAQAVADAEAARKIAFDDKVAAASTGDAVLTKIDNSIDNISNLADAKAWLKKLARYLLNANSD